MVGSSACCICKACALAEQRILDLQESLTVRDRLLDALKAEYSGVREQLAVSQAEVARLREGLEVLMKAPKDMLEYCQRKGFPKYGEKDYLISPSDFWRQQIATATFGTPSKGDSGIDRRLPPKTQWGAGRGEEAGE